MAGIWGDGQRGGIFGAKIDPRLQAELERRAAQKRAFDEQVANLHPSQIPPREMPQSFDETLTGTIGDMVYGAPVIGPAALGLGARIGAAGQALQGKQGYSQALEDIQTKQEQFRRLNPGISGSAQAGGSSIFAPAFGSSMGAQVVGNAAMGGLDAMARGQDPTMAGVVAGGIAGATHIPAIFAGVAAKTANHEMLALAKELKAAGASRDEIWQKTGWDVHAVDKQPKFEISDEAARFVPPTNVQPHRLELAQQRFEEQTGEPRIRFATSKWRDASTEALHWVDANIERLRAEAPKAKLQDVLVHPDLYAAHPELGNVETMPENFRGGGTKGSFSGRVGDADNPPLITYGGSERIFHPEDNRSTLLHEGMHGVQDIESFGRGANTTGLRPGTPAWQIYQERLKAIRTPMPRAEFDARYADPQSLYTYEKYLKEHKAGLRKNAQMLDRAAQETAVSEAYRRASGEVEARNVQKRMNMTAEERRATPPWKTQDVPDEQQIVRFRGTGGAQESRAKVPAAGRYVSSRDNMPPPERKGGPPNPLRPSGIPPDPRGPLFSPYSGIKQNIPVTETAPIYGTGGPRLQEKTFDPTKLKPGDRLVGFVGDRSYTGEPLVGIDISGKQVMFKNPVPSEGGAGYMRHVDNPQGALWASNQNPISSYERQLQMHQEAAARKGGDVYAVTQAMAVPGIDFSMQATRTAVEMLRRQPLTVKARESLYAAIDDAMTAPRGKDFRGIPDWPGMRVVMKKGGDEYLQGIGKGRAKLMKILDTTLMKKQGAPDMAAVRYAVTDPLQRNASVLESGHSWFKLGDEATRLSPEEVLRRHDTYPWVVASRGGEYAGSQPMPVELVFPGLARRTRGMDASGKQQIATLADVFEIITPQKFDKIMEWFNSPNGKKLGIAGAVAAGLLTAGEASDLFGDGTAPQAG